MEARPSPRARARRLRKQKHEVQTSSSSSRPIFTSDSSDGGGADSADEVQGGIQFPPELRSHYYVRDPSAEDGYEVDLRISDRETVPILVLPSPSASSRLGSATPSSIAMTPRDLDLDLCAITPNSAGPEASTPGSSVPSVRSSRIPTPPGLGVNAYALSCGPTSSPGHQPASLLHPLHPLEALHQSQQQTQVKHHPRFNRRHTASPRPGTTPTSALSTPPNTSTNLPPLPPPREGSSAGSSRSRQVASPGAADITLIPFISSSPLSRALGAPTPYAAAYHSHQAGRDSKPAGTGPASASHLAHGRSSIPQLLQSLSFPRGPSQPQAQPQLQPTQHLSLPLQPAQGSKIPSLRPIANPLHPAFSVTGARNRTAAASSPSVPAADTAAANGAMAASTSAAPTAATDGACSAQHYTVDNAGDSSCRTIIAKQEEAEEQIAATESTAAAEQPRKAVNEPQITAVPSALGAEVVAAAANAEVAELPGSPLAVADSSVIPSDIGRASCSGGNDDDVATAFECRFDSGSSAQASDEGVYKEVEAIAPSQLERASGAALCAASTGDLMELVDAESDVTAMDVTMAAEGRPDEPGVPPQRNIPEAPARESGHAVPNMTRELEVVAATSEPAVPLAAPEPEVSAATYEEDVPPSRPPLGQVDEAPFAPTQPQQDVPALGPPQLEEPAGESQWRVSAAMQPRPGELHADAKRNSPSAAPSVSSPVTIPASDALTTAPADLPAASSGHMARRVCTKGDSPLMLSVIADATVGLVPSLTQPTADFAESPMTTVAAATDVNVVETVAAATGAGIPGGSQGALPGLEGELLGPLEGRQEGWPPSAQTAAPPMQAPSPPLARRPRRSDMGLGIGGGGEGHVRVGSRMGLYDIATVVRGDGSTAVELRFNDRAASPSPPPSAVAAASPRSRSQTPTGFRGPFGTCRSPAHSTASSRRHSSGGFRHHGGSGGGVRTSQHSDFAAMGVLDPANDVQLQDLHDPVDAAVVIPVQQPVALVEEVALETVGSAGLPESQSLGSVNSSVRYNDLFEPPASSLPLTFTATVAAAAIASADSTMNSGTVADDSCCPSSEPALRAAGITGFSGAAESVGVACAGPKDPDSVSMTTCQLVAADLLETMRPCPLGSAPGFIDNPLYSPAGTCGGLGGPANHDSDVIDLSSDGALIRASTCPDCRTSAPVTAAAPAPERAAWPQSRATGQESESAGRSRGDRGCSVGGGSHTCEPDAGSGLGSISALGSGSVLGSCLGSISVISIDLVSEVGSGAAPDLFHIPLPSPADLRMSDGTGNRAPSPGRRHDSPRPSTVASSNRSSGAFNSGSSAGQDAEERQATSGLRVLDLTGLPQVCRRSRREGGSSGRVSEGLEAPVHGSSDPAGDTAIPACSIRAAADAVTVLANSVSQQPLMINSPVNPGAAMGALQLPAAVEGAAPAPPEPIAESVAEPPSWLQDQVVMGHGSAFAASAAGDQTPTAPAAGGSGTPVAEEKAMTPAEPAAARSSGNKEQARPLLEDPRQTKRRRTLTLLCDEPATLPHGSSPAAGPGQSLQLSPGEPAMVPLPTGDTAIGPVSPPANVREDAAPPMAGSEEGVAPRPVGVEEEPRAVAPPADTWDGDTVLLGLLLEETAAAMTVKAAATLAAGEAEDAAMDALASGMQTRQAEPANAAAQMADGLEAGSTLAPSPEQKRQDQFHQLSSWLPPMPVGGNVLGTGIVRYSRSSSKLPENVQSHIAQDERQQQPQQQPTQEAQQEAQIALPVGTQRVRFASVGAADASESISEEAKAPGHASGQPDAAAVFCRRRQTPGLLRLAGSKCVRFAAVAAADASESSSGGEEAPGHAAENLGGTGVFRRRRQTPGIVHMRANEGTHDIDGVRNVEDDEQEHGGDEGESVDAADGGAPRSLADSLERAIVQADAGAQLLCAGADLRAGSASDLPQPAIASAGNTAKEVNAVPRVLEAGLALGAAAAAEAPTPAPCQGTPELVTTSPASRKTDPANPAVNVTPRRSYADVAAAAAPATAVGDGSTAAAADGAVRVATHPRRADGGKLSAASLGETRKATIAVCAMAVLSNVSSAAGAPALALKHSPGPKAEAARVTGSPVSRAPEAPTPLSKLPTPGEAVSAPQSSCSRLPALSANAGVCKAPIPVEAASGSELPSAAAGADALNGKVAPPLPSSIALAPVAESIASSEAVGSRLSPACMQQPPLPGAGASKSTSKLLSAGAPACSSRSTLPSVQAATPTSQLHGPPLPEALSPLRARKLSFEDRAAPVGQLCQPEGEAAAAHGVAAAAAAAGSQKHNNSRSSSKLPAVAGNIPPMPGGSTGTPGARSSCGVVSTAGAAAQNIIPAPPASEGCFPSSGVSVQGTTAGAAQSSSGGGGELAVRERVPCSKRPLSAIPSFWGPSGVTHALPGSAKVASAAASRIPPLGGEVASPAAVTPASSLLMQAANRGAGRPAPQAAAGDRWEAAAQEDSHSGSLPDAARGGSEALGAQDAPAAGAFGASWSPRQLQQSGSSPHDRQAAELVAEAPAEQPQATEADTAAAPAGRSVALVERDGEPSERTAAAAALVPRLPLERLGIKPLKTDLDVKGDVSIVAGDAAITLSPVSSMTAAELDELLAEGATDAAAAPEIRGLDDPVERAAGRGSWVSIGASLLAVAGVVGAGMLHAAMTVVPHDPAPQQPSYLPHSNCLSEGLLSYRVPYDGRGRSTIRLRASTGSLYGGGGDSTHRSLHPNASCPALWLAGLGSEGASGAPIGDYAAAPQCAGAGDPPAAIESSKRSLGLQPLSRAAAAAAATDALASHPQYEGSSVPGFLHNDPAAVSRQLERLLVEDVWQLASELEVQQLEADRGAVAQGDAAEVPTVDATDVKWVVTEDAGALNDAYEGRAGAGKSVCGEESAPEAGPEQRLASGGVDAEAACEDCLPAHASEVAAAMGPPQRQVDPASGSGPGLGEADTVAELHPATPTPVAVQQLREAAVVEAAGTPTASVGSTLAGSAALRVTNDGAAAAPQLPLLCQPQAGAPLPAGAAPPVRTSYSLPAFSYLQWAGLYLTAAVVAAVTWLLRLGRLTSRGASWRSVWDINPAAVSMRGPLPAGARRGSAGGWSVGGFGAAPLTRHTPLPESYDAYVYVGEQEPVLEEQGLQLLQQPYSHAEHPHPEEAPPTSNIALMRASQVRRGRVHASGAGGSRSSPSPSRASGQSRGQSPRNSVDGGVTLLHLRNRTVWAYNARDMSPEARRLLADGGI